MPGSYPPLLELEPLQNSSCRMTENKVYAFAIGSMWILSLYVTYTMNCNCDGSL